MLFYLIAYLFMNLGAFAVVAFVRNQTGLGRPGRFRGLVGGRRCWSSRMASSCSACSGMPPLAGFAAKFQVFAVLYETGREYTHSEPFFGWYFFALLASRR